jgi:hypothetical protein
MKEILSHPDAQIALKEQRAVFVGAVYEPDRGKLCYLDHCSVF